MTASYIDFAEERLDFLGFDYGVVGGFAFSTEVLENKAKQEQRNPNYWLPLGRWQLGQRMLLDGDEKHIDEVAHLLAFHAARRGSQQGFRFKDWADFEGKDQLIGVGDGLTTVYQLQKTYTAGDASFVRPILKPVVGSVSVSIDEQIVTDFTLDFTTGVLTFDQPPSVNAEIKASFEFDVPVVFENDQIGWTLEAIQTEDGQTLHQLGDVFVKSLRINPSIPFRNFQPVPQQLSDPLDLGTLLKASEQYRFSTRIQSLKSGYSSHVADIQTPRNTIRIPQRNWDKEELDKILAYFWVCKGRLVPFTLNLNQKSYFCRFNSDQLSIRFVVAEEGDRLFQISNLDFYEIQAFNFSLLLANLPSVYVAGSVIQLAGLLINDDGLPIEGQELTFNFPFATTPVTTIAPNEDGFFALSLTIRPNLQHPDEGIFTVINNFGQELYSSLLITSADALDPFSISITNEMFLSGAYSVSGAAPAGQQVTLNAGDLIVNQVVVANASNNWRLDFELPGEFPTGNLIFTADTPGFEQASDITNVRELVFDPIVTNNSGLVIGESTSFLNEHRARANSRIFIVIRVDGVIINFISVVANQEGSFSFSQLFTVDHVLKLAEFEFTDFETNEVVTRQLSLPDISVALNLITLTLTTPQGLRFRGEDHAFSIAADLTDTVQLSGFGQTIDVVLDSEGNGTATITIPADHPFGLETVTATQVGADIMAAVNCRVDNPDDFALSINPTGQILTNAESQQTLTGLALPGTVINLAIPELGIDLNFSPDAFGVVNYDLPNLPWQLRGNYQATFSATGEQTIILSGNHRPDVRIQSAPSLVQGSGESIATIRAGANENVSLTVGPQTSNVTTNALGFFTARIPAIPLLTQAPSSINLAASADGLSDQESISIGVRVPLTINVANPPLAEFPNVLFTGQTYQVAGDAPSNGVLNNSAIGSSVDFDVDSDENDQYSATLELSDRPGSVALNLSTIFQPSVARSFVVEHELILDTLPATIDRDDGVFDLVATTAPNIVVTLNFLFKDSEDLVYFSFEETFGSDLAGNVFYQLDPLNIEQDGSIEVEGRVSASYFVKEIATATYINNPNPNGTEETEESGIFFASSPDLANGLIAYYPLDDISENISPDVSGNANHLTVNPTGVQNFVDGGVQLTRSQLGKLYNPNLKPFFGTDWTLAIWINFVALPPSNQAIFSQSHIGGINAMVARFTSPTNLNLRIGTASLNETFPNITIDTWYLFLMDFNFETSQYSVFWNNSLIGQGNSPTIPNLTTRGFIIGAEDFFNGDLVRHSDIRIRECGIWNRLLITDERADVYNDGQGLLYLTF